MGYRTKGIIWFKESQTAEGDIVMMTNFKRTFVPLLKALGLRKEKRIFTDIPIIIGGGARSGTTLLLSILSAHPDIFALRKELGLFKYGKEVDGRFCPGAWIVFIRPSSEPASPGR